MAFSLKGFIKGLTVALIVVTLAVLADREFHLFNFFGDAADTESAAYLSNQASEALEAVKNRKPGERRPASYDAVLAPLDKMLSSAKSILGAEDYNPALDSDKVRSYTLPVIDIANKADAQARTETGPLTKEYRFNDQKGEASYYLASALWNRVSASQRRVHSSLEESPPLPVGDMNEIRRLLDDGIVAAPDNRDLYYLRGVINRAEGLFAPAARDLERAVELDPTYAEAWNTLGLVQIGLREFDQAEAAYERAKVLAVQQARHRDQDPGPDYVAAVYNLARFHDELAAFFNRENRVNPSVENRRLYARHADDARRNFEEFLTLEPEGPDSRDARERLAALR